jgi:predicted phosphoribosyltransferase
MVFRDRYEAGAALARRLDRFADRDDVVVLALPRGGVPVAFQVAESLGAPLDVFVVRKLGMPGHPEYAIGAIASGGVRVLSEDAIRALRIPAVDIESVTVREQAELHRREREYRQGLPPISIRGHTVILVDDGLATGSTMTAAVQAVRRLEPARVVVAVPVGAPQSCEELTAVADEVVCLATPEPFQAVGLWYRDFSQTSDEEVRALLRRRAEHQNQLESHR